MANRKPTPAAPPAPSFTRVERIIGFMLMSIVGLSLLCFVATLIGYGTKAITGPTVAPIWQVVILLPDIGFPIALILIVVLLILVVVRRSRDARDAGK